MSSELSAIVSGDSQNALFVWAHQLNNSFGHLVRLFVWHTLDQSHLRAALHNGNQVPLLLLPVTVSISQSPIPALGIDHSGPQINAHLSLDTATALFGAITFSAFSTGMTEMLVKSAAVAFIRPDVFIDRLVADAQCMFPG